MSQEDTNIVSNTAGHGIGFPAGAIAVFSQMSPSIVDSPLKSLFAVASLAMGAICVWGASRATTVMKAGYSAPEVVKGAVTGAIAGVSVMLIVGAAEEAVEPSRQSLLQLFRQESVEPLPTPGQNVCVMSLDGPPPAAPGCAP